MQVTKGTWCMCEQCVPGSLSSSSPTREPGNEANGHGMLLLTPETTLTSSELHHDLHHRAFPACSHISLWNVLTILLLTLSRDLACLAWRCQCYFKDWLVSSITNFSILCCHRNLQTFRLCASNIIKTDFL